MNVEDFLGKPTEEEIIANSKTNRLYSSDFGNGKYFQVVFEDENSTLIKLASRTMLKVLYINEKNDLKGFEIIKLIDENEKQKVSFSSLNMAQLKAFLSFISEIDLKGLSAGKIKILNDDKELDEGNISKIKTLLSKEGGAEIVETLINDGIISKKDIVNTSFRKRGLEIFKKLLENEGYWKIYAKENNENDSSEEKVWQYFFKKNQWIFGYGLDYRFQEILQKEAQLSETNIDGKNAVIVDFLLGDKFFTTFVELKKPSTKLFGKSKKRTNAWQLSNDLIESVSQILEQKASGLLRFEKQQYIDGEPVKQKAYDSKVILIIGNWQEIENSNSTYEKEVKKKTFELFRRDSRNIEILTYDELYERACFIVEGNEKEL